MRHLLGVFIGTFTLYSNLGWMDEGAGKVCAFY